YVYTTPGSDPLGRLNQPGHPFLAMNAATVSGPGVDFATQFVAVNRLHILVAQETMSISAVPEEVAATSGDVTP
ncbi:MAG TPA: hypothetical protein VFT43_12715, partial [Candidatus Polarisedimenticolia bacterium]|nr:hypothetical protein [Candidatus Polarisedimenticolia bacterium]